MPGRFPSLENTPSRAERLTIVVAAAALVGRSITLATAAYLGTPNVANFRHFAEPTSSKFEPKILVSVRPRAL